MFIKHHVFSWTFVPKIFLILADEHFSLCTANLDKILKIGNNVLDYFFTYVIRPMCNLSPEFQNILINRRPALINGVALIKDVQHLESRLFGIPFFKPMVFIRKKGYFVRTKIKLIFFISFSKCNRFFKLKNKIAPDENIAIQDSSCFILFC